MSDLDVPTLRLAAMSGPTDPSHRTTHYFLAVDEPGGPTFCSYTLNPKP